MSTQNEETDNEIKNKYWAKVTPESRAREIERLRSLARHNEASALGHARDEERKKCQEIIASKDAIIASKNSIIENKEAVIACKEAEIIAKDAEIACLREQLEGK